MKKISKFIKCLMLGSLLLAANSQKAEAFLFPPMPWDPVLDIPGDASKYIGQAFKIKHTLSSGFNLDNAMGLTGLKGGFIDGAWSKLKEAKSPEMDTKGKIKTPGKGAVSASSELKIDADSVDEEQFFNAYHTLFFTHDFNAGSIEGASPSLLETAYKNKAEEYQQDVAIDTYLSAKLVEDYLATADKTLNRLERCQSGDFDEKECIFFGLKMAKVTDETSSGESDSDNKAQLAAARNAYIVTMVYDRLLRVVEDLTAIEAVFQSSRQMGIAQPISESEKQSSAAEYINGKYRFAYADSQNGVFAKGTPIVNFNNKAAKCEGSNDPKKCPQLNKDKTKIKNVEKTEVLKQLQPIEGYINKAVTVHNLKSSLPQMKSLYRQYLLQQEIHRKAKILVETSEQCIVNFLNRHADNDMKQAWYGGAEPQGEKRFEYNNRKGIAGELIREYDEKSINIAIGTSEDCNGLYEQNSCPAGYTWVAGENEQCKGMGTCEIELITEEAEEGEAITQIDENYTGGKDVSKINAKYKDMADTDGFMDGTNAETTIQDSRKSAELSWYLGRDKLLETMKKQEMKFKPWNDQKMLQAEYLRNKYRNIGLIIRSTDQAVASFKLAEKVAQSYSSEDVATKYIKAAASCESIANAKTKARAKYCTSEYTQCSVTDNDGMIITKRKKNETRYDSEGNPYIVTVSVPDITENQKVSLGYTCVYTKGASAVNTEEICLTPTCLVRTYFKKAWGDADGFYHAAKGKGRVIAVNKLQAVITERKDQEDKVKTLVKKYQEQIRATKIAVENAIIALSSTNKAIDEARKNKNVANEELGKTNRRLTAIGEERETLKNRKDNINKEDLCAKEQRLGNLDNEESCLKTGRPAKSYSCASCKGLSGLSKAEQDCSKKELSCVAFLTTFEVQNKTLVKNDAEKYINKPSAIATQKKYESQIEEKTAQLEMLKERVKTLQEQLKAQTEEFATEYLKAENDAQEAIEEKNQEYEDFMVDSSGENQRFQMRNANKTECYKKGALGIGCKKKGPKRIEKNNLEATFTNIISNKALEKVMEDELNRIFFSGNNVVSLLTKAGVPGSFVVDGTFSAIGLPAGATTVQALAEKLKDNVVRIAAKELTAKIKAADEKVEKAVKNGEDKVKDFMDAHNINGTGQQTPSQSYLEKPSADHQPLLNELRNISKNVVEGENLFGIPEDAEFASMLDKETAEENDAITDTAFFVGLPARSNNYRDKAADDANAGRDYMSPHDMLASLPPLREIFYFSAADYEDIPQEKGKPVLTELLKGKYCNESNNCEYEYLPEVWLHILARPNLRADKKYQQTFIERSFSDAKLNDLVQNRLANSGIIGAKASDYRAIIGRSGVYPCRTKGGIVDMGGGDKVPNMRFKTRSSLPAGMTSVPTCQEVELKGVNAYHLLADHGKGKNIKDTEKTSPTNEPMYEKHSELGQLLTEKMAYRPLQKNIHEYLNDSKNEDNNIERQKAELASFKRNVMGDFLVTVTTEYNARKNLESMQKTVDEMRENLCTQLAEIWKENGEDYDVESCKKQALASNYKDTAYFEQGEDKEYGKIKCSQGRKSFYEQVFCDLDTKKDKYVKDAQNALKATESLGAPTEEAKAYLEERLEKIKNYIDNDGTLIVDNKEISIIQPDIDRAEIKGVVLTAKANRRVMLDSAEEGLQATENQNQAVAYCPVY